MVGGVVMKKIKKAIFISLLSPLLIFSAVQEADAHHRPGHGGGVQENGNGKNKTSVVVDEEPKVQEPIEEPKEDEEEVEDPSSPAPDDPGVIDDEDEALLGYSLTGRGWGHSVGMTQWGAKGMADAGYSYQEIIHYYYTGVNIGKMNTDNLNIRVALSLDIPIAYVMGMGTYHIVDVVSNNTIATFNPYTTTSISFNRGMYVVTNGQNTIHSSNPISITSASSMYHKGIQYLGDFHISSSINGNVDVINHLNIETYLTGVVPHEIYVSWPAATIKAQTLAARTYALKNRVPHRKFDVFDTVASQVYKGISVIDARINSLIELTRGEVILYNGQLIDALYSASAGGHTIDSGDIWSPTPYLVGKPDPFDQSPYMENWWEVSLTLADLTKKFPEVGNLQSIVILELKYDRPTKVKVVGEHAELILTGYQFRERIGYDKMFSSTFILSELK
jgi:SpoIID/LytB domain protein